MSKTPHFYHNGQEWKPLTLFLNRNVDGGVVTTYTQADMLKMVPTIVGKAISFLEHITYKPQLTPFLVRLRNTACIELVMPAIEAGGETRTKVFKNKLVPQQDGSVRKANRHDAWIDTRSRVLDCLVCMLRYRAFVKRLIEAEKLSDEELKAMLPPLEHYGRNWAVVKEVFGVSYRRQHEALMRRIAISEVHTPETQVVTAVEQELEIPVT